MSLFSEIIYYLKTHRRWWLLPIIIVFLFFAAIFAIGHFAPVVSPFIYTLF